VTRASLRGGAASGIAFFLAVEPAPGAVAVGAFRTFDGTDLAESGELRFEAAGGKAVARSRRYYARPGRSYYDAGATEVDDYVVFTLEARPEGVAILVPALGLPAEGDRVRVVGLPVGGRSEVEVDGRVVASDAGRIEVETGRVDLRGWGGAPVLDAAGEVLGLLHSARPVGGGRMLLGVGPVAGVRAALAAPYEGGIGRLFSTLAPRASAANDASARRRTATGSDAGYADPSETAAEVIEEVIRRDGRRPSPPQLYLSIEEPAEGATIGDAVGAFVAGRALLLRDDARRLDIVVVIDTSDSTGAPTGLDVDGDGLVGQPLRVDDEGGFEDGLTDEGDSILAAQVAAARRLIESLDLRTTRVGIVTFAGLPRGPIFDGPVPVRRAAITRQPLTSDRRRLDRALDATFDAGSDGMTHIAAGADLASLELLGLEGSISRADPASEKIVLFFTDGTPTLPHPTSEADNVTAALRSALRARRAGIRIHTFAIGPEALAGPIAAVEMAAITEGRFTPVRDPGRLGTFMQTVSFAGLASLEVRNATTGRSAHLALLHADGSWDALVPLEPGANRVEAIAHAQDGSVLRAEVLLNHVPGAGRPTLPVELVGRHNALLDARLNDIRAEQVEGTRQQLELEIQVEREAAERRAEEQRKELELEVERPDGAPGS
jgi:hypothetical protein